MDKKEKQIFIFCFSIVIVLHIVLMASLRLYPLIDLPMHLASATIYRHTGETDNAFQQFYQIQDIIGRPNTFHLVFCSLKIFPSVEFANKVFMCFYTLLFPFSFFLLIKKCNGNWWYALPGFLLIYNFNVIWGFTGYFLAIPIFLFFLSFLQDFLYKDHYKYYIYITFIFLFIYFIHGLLFLYTLFLFAVCLLYVHRKSIKKMFLKFLPVLPALSFYLFWWLRSGDEYIRTGTKDFLIDIFQYYKVSYIQSLSDRLSGLFYWDNMALFPGQSGKFYAVVISLIILFWVVYSFIFFSKKSFKEKNITQQIQLGIIWILCSLLVYLLIPQMKSFMIFSYYRFSVLIWLSVILIISMINPIQIRLTKTIPVLLVTLIHFFLWTDYFLDFQKENKSFTKDFFPEGPTNAVLTGIIENNRFRGESIYIHFPDYYIIWKKGIAPSSFLYLKKIWRIRQKGDNSQLPFYNEWFSNNEVFDSNYKNVDYLLTRGQLSKKTMDSFQHFELLKTVNNWKLFVNRTRLNN